MINKQANKNYIDAPKWRDLIKEWELQVKPIRELTRELLKEHFGTRCSDYEKKCLCCKRWKLLKKLLRNPYE